MAEYDPAAPLSFDAAEDDEMNGEVHDDLEEEKREEEEEEEEEDGGEDGGEDDDYDPSSFNVSSNEDSHPPPSQVTKPKTIGGFLVDSDDEDEQDATQVPPPSQLNGEEGSQSGLGAVAVAEAKEVNDSIHSEPQEDTAAVSSAPQTAQSAHLTGSSSDVPFISTTAQSPAPAPSLSNTPTPFQNPTPQDKGKPVEPSHSVTATPQPANNAPIPPPVSANHTAAAPVANQRLPHDKVGHLEDRIKEDPKAETEAWKSLIAHYREKDQLDNARKVYWRFLEVFPSATSVWYEFAQMELDHEQMQRVEEIFGACLTQYPNVDMWNLYLDYLRRIHPLINDSDGSKRSIIASAFEVVLDHVGIDPDAGKLWREYVEFIKTGPGVAGGTGWQDQQKMDLLRKAYQRAVRLPHGEYAKLWKEYDNFELSINRANARQNLMTQSPHYMTARGARSQLEQRLEGLDRTGLPVLPPLHDCAGEDQFATQVIKYAAWIAWEKDDPLVLKDDEIAQYRKRVVYAYKQAAMHLRFYPPIWFEAANWCFEQETEDMVKEGEEFLDKGVVACPESVLLALKKADRVEDGLEQGNNDEVAIRNGTKLDVPYESVHVALYALSKKLQERMQKALEEVKAHFASLPPEEGEEQQDGDDDDDNDGNDQEKPKSRAEQQQLQLAETQRMHQRRLETTKRTISYVWVAKMRAFRRVQGQGAPKNPRKGFRGLFAEARPRGQLSSDVYIASALMEWHCYKDPSAGKIFERGLKLFPLDENFALEYMKYLVSRGDDVNARAVFETTMTKITSATAAQLSEDDKREKCRPLLQYMHQYESAFGDLSHIKRLEKRMKEMFPTETELSILSQRFELPAFDAIRAQLVISPTQAIPKPPVDANLAQHILPSIEQQQQQQQRFASPADSSHIRLGPNGPYVASPKRPLDDSDGESPQRSKFMRGESPLKGAAGRRLQNLSGSTNASAVGAPAAAISGGGGGGGGYMTKNYVPGAAAASVGVGAAPLPDKIHLILSIIPRPEFYQITPFNAARMVDLLRGVDVDGARARVGY